MNTVSLIDSLKLSAYSPTLEELNTRLSEYETVRQGFKVPNPASIGARFDNREDFDARGWLLEMRNARKYLVKGHSLYLMLSEDFALKLDEVRSLRLAVAKYDQDTKEGAEARQKLAAHSYGKRALPEDLLVHIDELPDSGLLQCVLLLDEANVEDVWLSQTYVNNFISSAAVEPNGDLLLFKRDLDGFLREDLFHEWGHRLEKQSPDEVKLFELAIALEMAQKDAYQLSLYAGRNTSEHWAVAIEHMLGENTERVRALVEKAPLRAVLVSLAAKRSFAGESFSLCKQSTAFSRRLTYMETTAKPEAKKFLESLEQNETTGKLLAHLLS